MEKQLELLTYAVEQLGQHGWFDYVSLAGALIAAVISVIALLATVFFNIKSNRNYIQSLSPLLSMNLSEFNGSLVLMIENTGQSAAKDIVLEFIRLENNAEVDMRVDPTFLTKFELYPKESISGMIAFSGASIVDDVFPQLFLNIHYTKGNDGKEEKLHRKISFTRPFINEKSELDGISRSLKSIMYSENRIANYIEGRTLFTFDSMNVMPHGSLKQDMTEAFSGKFNTEDDDSAI